MCSCCQSDHGIPQPAQARCKPAWMAADHFDLFALPKPARRWWWQPCLTRIGESRCRRTSTRSALGQLPAAAAAAGHGLSSPLHLAPSTRAGSSCRWCAAAGRRLLQPNRRPAPSWWCTSASWRDTRCGSGCWRLAGGTQSSSRCTRPVNLQTCTALRMLGAFPKAAMTPMTSSTTGDCTAVGLSPACLAVGLDACRCLSCKHYLYVWCSNRAAVGCCGCCGKHACVARSLLPPPTTCITPPTRGTAVRERSSNRRPLPCTPSCCAASQAAACAALQSLAASRTARCAALWRRAAPFSTWSCGTLRQNRAAAGWGPAAVRGGCWTEWRGMKIWRCWPGWGRSACGCRSWRTHCYCWTIWLAAQA